MKILQVIPYFTPQRGGDVNICYNLSKELSKKDHQVTIITTDFEFDEDYIKSIRQFGVEVIPFKHLFEIGLFIYSPSMKNWLANNLKNYHIIHLHNLRSYQNSLVHSYAKKSHIPFILQTHGSAQRIVEKQRLKGLYDLFWGKKLLNDAQGLIAVSKIELEQYKEMGLENKNIFLIPNALDIDRFKNLPEKGKFKKRLGMSKNSRVVLYLGRIHKRKGIEVLIKSFNEILNEIDNVFLVIAGPDENYKKFLEKLVVKLSITDKVKFVNYTENVLEIYVDADVLVYPATYEIFGLVPFEAILCNTPVIVTNDCGCGALIEEIDGGYLVEYGDVEDLKLKIKNSLENTTEAAEMIERGKKYINNNLTWDHVLNEFERAYEDCIRNF